jgi:hypothetical protein
MVRLLTVLLVLAGVSARASADNPDCDRFKVNDPDNYLDTANRLAIGHAIGCQKYDWNNEKPQLATIRFAIDLPGAEESQIISADFVFRSLDTSDARNAFDRYLFSGYDARRLDAKKLEAEIAARKLSPESANNVRAVFKKAQERNAWVLQQFDQYKTENYDYKKLFVDVADAGAADWQKLYQEHKDVYDLGTSIERQLSDTDRGKRGYQNVDVKGCTEMHKVFKDYLASSQKGKLAPEIAQFLESDPLAFEMLSSLVVCDGLRGFKVDAAGQYDLIEHGRMWRGPRTAGYWAALAAAKEIEARTNNSSPIQRGGAGLGDHKLLLAGKDIFETNFTINRDPETAKVAALKKLGDGWVEISFKVEKWMEPDFECVDVKPLHFNHWGQNGQPVWDWTCHVKSYHEEKREEKPHAFSETAATGIKPGMLVKMKTASQQKAPAVQAFPLEVSLPAKTKKDKPKLISFSGIPLQ